MATCSSLLNRIHAALGRPDAQLARAEHLAESGSQEKAFTLFARAARAGQPRAQYQLARHYLAGLTVPGSLIEALRWLRRAAEAGESAAQTQLAALALQGITDAPLNGLHHPADQPANYEQAESWCRQAVAAGSAEAMALLAYILTEGPADRRDPAAGERLFRQSAQAGCPHGQLGLAVALLRSGDAANLSQIQSLLHAAAAADLGMAHHLLGVLAETGAAGQVDHTQAATRYRQAADLGHAPAQLRYAFALLDGRGVPRDPFAAETLLRRAALAGDAQAAAVIGFLYTTDADLPPNYAEAAQWLRRAAETGHTAAARILGHILLGTNGVPRDVTEAAHWLLLAASGGDVTARADIARLALTRQIAEDDQRQVAALLSQAAGAGDPVAQFDLGLCLAQGIGTDRNEQAGLDWVRLAARGGHSPATRMLAELGSDA